MARPKKEDKVVQLQDSRQSRPATTPEGRERQMISLAVDLAERQLRDGTASSTVITHYLKLGTTREAIEREMLEKQKALLEAKTESIKDSKKAEASNQELLEAFRSYSPSK